MKRTTLGILVLISVSLSNGQVSLFKNSQVNIFQDEHGTSWKVNNKNDKAGLSGHILDGQNIPSEKCSSDSIFCRQDRTTRVEIKLADSCLHFSSESEVLTDVLRDCVDLEDAHWFGGPEQHEQLWPIEKLKFSDYSYVTKEIDYMAVAERYWLNSKGIYIYVDSTVPLFIDQHNYRNNSLCFIAKNAAPYLDSRPTLELKYSVCGLAQANAKEAHYDAIERFLHKPTGVPDEMMVRHPIWSTWAHYKGDISQDLVLEFAHEILDNGFNNSQMEIDDRWETCYGSLTVDTSDSKFPSMRDLSLELKELGFRVTIWVTPFVNVDCEPYYSLGVENDYFLKNIEGNITSTWWRGTGAHVNFMNPDAVEWWVGRLNLLREEEMIDSFKFDAGESSFAPQVPVLDGPLEDQPNIISMIYAETCAQFGDFIEIRVGYKTQHLPVFVRMIDKDSRWDFNNGIKTLVTTLLQMNMVGYPFVLPDMIGGNGYGLKPNSELFLRWLQANTFMPSLQFSYVPWDFGQETVEISKKFTQLHDQYTGVIMSLAQKAVEDGSPINPPIWWADPEDIIALGINDEYLLGEDILVAPVLDEGATSRDIYLPRGTWVDYENQQQYIGPTWIRNFPAPIDVLPFFSKLADKYMC